jgi:hypothetical protein
LGSFTGLRPAAHENTWALASKQGASFPIKWSCSPVQCSAGA